MTISLASLLNVETYAALLQKALDVAESVGLPVTSWRAGDPTRAQYHYLAEVLSTLEPSVQQAIAAGFLDYAEGDALTNVALQMYGVERVGGTHAASTLTLENTGGGFYPIEVRELTFKSSVTGLTYQNTTAGTLLSGPGTTLELGWVAVEEGAESSVIADEIDQMVTTLLGVEIQSSVAGAGVDQESDEALRQRCRDSLGALSPNGPADAYGFVATTPALTGVETITRYYVDHESLTGDVTVYLAGPSGPVDGASETAASDAIAQWSTPLTVTPAVQSADPLELDTTLTVYVLDSLGKSESQVQEEAENAWTALLTTFPIGGHDGELKRSLIEGRVIAAVGAIGCGVTTPGADPAVAVSEVVTPGTFTCNVVFVDG